MSAAGRYMSGIRHMRCVLLNSEGPILAWLMHESPRQRAPMGTRLQCFGAWWIVSGSSLAEGGAISRKIAGAHRA
jgi:hypothetical protein